MSIWHYKEIKNTLDSVEENKLITLNEGDTPLERFVVDSNTLFIKREDQNPTGSWKDRGTAYKLSVISCQLSDNKTENRKLKTEYVIASSGNAAISLLTYAKQISEIKVNVVVSPNANESKIKKIKELIKDTNHELHFAENAKKKRAELVSKGSTLISSATDPDFIKGYWSLGFELAKVIKSNLDKQNFLICPVSSGGALVGIAEGLFSKLENEYKMPKIIACQTQSCSPLVSAPSYLSEREGVGVKTDVEKSLADAIVDQSMLRKPQVEKILRETDGKALVITNKELQLAKEFTDNLKVKNLSWTSLLSIAGYLKLKSNFQNTNFICIASGT